MSDFAIITYYYIYVPWMALSTRHAVSFCWACVLSMPKAESRLLAFDPGRFTFSLCEVWAASPLQLIRLPNLMISDSQCTTKCSLSQLALRAVQV